MITSLLCNMSLAESLWRLTHFPGSLSARDRRQLRTSPSPCEEHPHLCHTFIDAISLQIFRYQIWFSFFTRNSSKLNILCCSFHPATTVVSCVDVSIDFKNIFRDLHVDVNCEAGNWFNQRIWHLSTRWCWSIETSTQETTAVAR